MENKTSDQEIDFLEILKIVVKNKIVILLCFGAGVLFAFGVAIFMPKIYQSEATIKIGTVENRLTEGTSFVADPNQLVGEIDSLFLQKYPLLSAVYLSNGLVKISNYSGDKKMAEAGVSEAVQLIISENGDGFKNKIQTEMKELKMDMDSLRVGGQQTEVLVLRLFDMQNEIDSFVSSEIIEQPAVFLKQRPSVIFDIIIGGILGIFIGLVIAFTREWWSKNKKEINGNF